MLALPFPDGSYPLDKTEEEWNLASPAERRERGDVGFLEPEEARLFARLLMRACQIVCVSA